MVETLTLLLAYHWCPALRYYSCDCHDIFAKLRASLIFFDTAQVIGPCVYRKSHAVIHMAHRILNDQSCWGHFTITTFCAVREFSTQYIAFEQVQPE